MIAQSPSYIDSISPIKLARVTRGRKHLTDDYTSIFPTDAWDENIDTALHLAGGALEYVARHSTGQGVSTVTFDADRLQEPFQRSSPVTRLHPEILGYIFEIYVARLWQLTPCDVRAQGPSQFTQVCTFWRAVAESDPQLWTSIHFYFPESRQNLYDAPTIQPVLDLHLKLSSPLPISFTFTDHRTCHSDSEDLIYLLVDRLQTHSRRWKRISLRLSCDYFPFLFPFAKSDLSSLEHLRISGDELSQDFFGFLALLHLNLKSAKNLKSFAYSGPEHSVDSIHLHWNNLSDVSFEYSPHSGRSSTLYQQFRHLSNCCNVTTCSLGIESANPPRMPEEVGQIITLPCLETLRVRRLSPNAHASGAIDLLILPRLQTLVIDASILVGWNRRWHDHTFSGLLARSGCTLFHLSVEDVDFPNEELVRCLALSPALTSLRFIPCPRSHDISHVIHKLDIPRVSTDDPIQAQRYEDGHVADASPLVLQLREITLASSVEGYLDLMMAMFHSRSGPHARDVGAAPLRRIEVVFFDLWHDMDVGLVDGRRDRSERVAVFQAELARLVSENDCRGEGGGADEDRDELVASVVVNSPYLPEYIDV